MPRARTQGAWIRTAGLVTAGAMLALVGAFVAWRVLTQPNAISQGPAPAAAQPQAITDAPSPVDLASIGQSGGGLESFHSGGGINIRLEDAETGRVTSLMNAESLDPLGANRYDVDEPTAWIYTKDGQRVHVRADEGEVLMPSRQNGPESGVFRGDVRIRVYEPENDDVEIDLDNDEPAAEIRAPALVFDLTFGEVSTPDDDGPTPVEVLTPEIAFYGHGLRLLVSEVNNRVERLDITERGRLEFRPRETPDTATARDEPRDEPTPTDEPAETTADVAPREPKTNPAPPPDTREITLYHVTFDDEVVAQGEGREITADRLELWLRLIDNELPPGAIADVSTDLDQDEPASEGEPAPEPTIAADDTGFGLVMPPPDTDLVANGAGEVRTPEPEPSDAVAITPEPDAPLGTLTWSGPLRIVPILDGTPPELDKGNHLTGRFTAPETGAVRFQDETANVKGSAGAIGYFATTRDLRLDGAGPAGVALEADRGRLAGARLAMNLGTGLVHMPGAGALEAAVRGAITWQDQADFTFETRDGGMTNALRLAVLQGAVRATDGRGSMRAEVMRAIFVEDERRPARIHTLKGFEGVVAEDGRGGSLISDRLGIVFRPATDEERAAGYPEDDPEIVTAEGDVFAQKDSSSIICDTLETRLARFDGNDLDARHVLATGSPVQFDRLEDELSVTTLQLIANTEHQTVRLQGDDSVIGRGEVSISGEQISLDGRARTVEVFGPGVFTREPSGDASVGLIASWASQMRFDDRRGLIEAFGAVEADAAAGRARVDRLRAERLRIELAPLDDDAESPIDIALPTTNPTDPADGATNELGDRPILRAIAWGAEDDYPGGARATFEARRYAPDDFGPAPENEGPRLERLLFIEGNQIIADKDSGQLEVPLPGQMLLFDRQQLQAGVAPGSDEDRRGRAHFTWTGGMVVEQNAGRATIRDDVTLAHRRETDATTTTLDCETLVAEFDASGVGSESEEGSLRSVLASGNAHAQSGQREVAAETLLYDALQGVIDASSTLDDVALFDGATGRTIRAARLLWDLTRDRVEIKQPAGVRSPR